VAVVAIVTLAAAAVVNAKAADSLVKQQ